MRRCVVLDLHRVRFRRARGSDAPAIAALHADSWRRHYRGAYSDAFLDGEVDADRLAVWTSQFRHRQPHHCTIVAAAVEVVGFAHMIFDDDPTWGSLVENLHIVNALQGRGIGTQLLAESAQAVRERNPSTGLYVWVLEQNTAAQAFYEARGGRCVERGLAFPPGGDPARLVGTPGRLRYVWPDPSELLRWWVSGAGE
jgi:ribosomal protein S18 acetylase RimI-like enzyme